MESICSQFVDFFWNSGAENNSPKVFLHGRSIPQWACSCGGFTHVTTPDWYCFATYKYTVFSLWLGYVQYFHISGRWQRRVSALVLPEHLSVSIGFLHAGIGLRCIICTACRFTTRP